MNIAHEGVHAANNHYNLRLSTFSKTNNFHFSRTIFISSSHFEDFRNFPARKKLTIPERQSLDLTIAIHEQNLPEICCSGKNTVARCKKV